jgi:hypothetical protein
MKNWWGSKDCVGYKGKLEKFWPIRGGKYRVSDWPYFFQRSLQQTYSLLSNHFNIHEIQISHTEDGGSGLHGNVGTHNFHTA